jgi:hypothetical protein
MFGMGIIPLPIIPLTFQFECTKDFLTEVNEGNEGSHSTRSAEMIRSLSESSWPSVLYRI